MAWWGWLLAGTGVYALVLAGVWALLVAAHRKPKKPGKED